MTTDELGQIRWNYMLMRHTVEPSDAILVLGNNDLRVAEHGADLYLHGLASRIAFSGNVGKLTKGRFFDFTRGASSKWPPMKNQFPIS